jgi:hypothetical protein
LRPNVPLVYSLDDQKDYHEALAQYFTWLTIQDYAELLAVFEQLEQHQSERYRLWRQIPLTLEQSHGILKTDIQGLKKKSFPIISLHALPGRQSFENLKDYLNGRYDNTIKIRRFGI